MKPIALRTRLLLASAISIFVALGLAGIGISALFAAHIEADMVSGLSDEMNRLVALVTADDAAVTLSQPMPDPRYLKPYGGIYWQINDPSAGALVWSRSVWDATLEIPGPLAPAGKLLETTIVDPEGTTALAIVQQLDFETGSGTRLLYLIVAEDREALDQAIVKFRQDLFLGLSVLGAMLVGASWVQVAVGLSPLNAIRIGVGQINSGAHKQLAGRFPAEVMPLVTEVNTLLANQETSIGFARARAADLAHGLKTALTLLNVQAELLRKQGQNGIADAIQNVIRSMAETIDHQLALARLRHRSRSTHYAVEPGPVVSKVLAAVQATPVGRSRQWFTSVSPDARIDLDAADLLELLGILLENAARWSTASVTLAIAVEHGHVVISVDDDGIGVPEDAIALLGERGKRLDEREAGSGLGLAIVEEIVTLNNGSIRFSRSSLGGLSVQVTLPASGTAHFAGAPRSDLGPPSASRTD